MTRAVTVGVTGRSRRKVQRVAGRDGSQNQHVSAHEGGAPRRPHARGPSPVRSHTPENRLPHPFPAAATAITAPDSCGEKWARVDSGRPLSAGLLFHFVLPRPRSPEENIAARRRRVAPPSDGRKAGATSHLKVHVPPVTFRCFRPFCP